MYILSRRTLFHNERFDIHVLKKWIVCIFTSILILNGCQKYEEPPEDKTLTIITNNGSIFTRQYGNFFRATHPNFDLEIISIFEERLPDEHIHEAIERLISERNPDVITLSLDSYELFVEQNMLAPLTPFMDRDQFDIGDFMPAVIEALKIDQNQIYGLSPTFSGSALYYNKKIFMESGVPFPAESMTWDELFQLAQRIPISSNDGLAQFGYHDRYAENPFLMALYIGGASGLTFYNNNEFILTTQPWQNIFENVMNCFKTQACYNKKSDDTPEPTDLESTEKKNNPFLRGNIAMAVSTSYLAGKLTDSENYADLEWGIVPLPSGPEQQGIGSGFQVHQIFSIPTTSGKAEDAWKFIKYVNSENYAKLMIDISPSELPIRIPEEEHHNKPFYEINSISNITLSSLTSLPGEVVPKVDEIIDQYMPDFLENDVPVEQALEIIEAELQSALDAALMR